MNPLLSKVFFVLGLAAGLGGCALPERTAQPARYDFGPGGATQALAADASRPTLALRVQASPALEGDAMLYRLAYTDATQLRAYALARWTMPPAELLRQRVRETLGTGWPVLAPGEGASRLLRLELEEFAQVFETPERSAAHLRLRATVLQLTPAGERAVAQHSLLLRQPAASADAPGGVRALALASDAAAQELAQWLKTLP